MGRRVGGGDMNRSYNSTCMVDAYPLASRQLTNNTCCRWCHIYHMIKLCLVASYPYNILQNSHSWQLPLPGPRANLENNWLTYIKFSFHVAVNQNSLV